MMAAPTALLSYEKEKRERDEREKRIFPLRPLCPFFHNGLCWKYGSPVRCFNPVDFGRCPFFSSNWDGL
ncbi:MAG: hypothetical protein DRN78_00155 [Thermoproteota archaeon]|nr:MAG: hypothetical protein DRN78_00155 [Candidatus Korarchaeota archaeon]